MELVIKHIKISDGTETEAMEGTDIQAAIAEYVKGYGFNEPGDVECVVKVSEEDNPTYQDWITHSRFTIRSEDGRSGYLVQV